MGSKIESFWRQFYINSNAERCQQKRTRWIQQFFVFFIFAVAAGSHVDGVGGAVNSLCAFCANVSQSNELIFETESKKRENNNNKNTCSPNLVYENKR